MEVQRKTVFAASLLLLWAGLAIWQWGMLEEPRRVPLANVTGPASSGQQAGGSGRGFYVNIDLLTRIGIRREVTFMAPRNVFAMPRSQDTVASAFESDVNRQGGPTSAEIITEQVTAMEPGSDPQYLGFVRVGEGKEKNKNMAILRKDDEVLVLKVGDRIDDHLVLKAISSESVILQDPGTRRDRTVVLFESPIAQE